MLSSPWSWSPQSVQLVGWGWDAPVECLRFQMVNILGRHPCMNHWLSDIWCLVGERWTMHRSGGQSCPIGVALYSYWGHLVSVAKGGHERDRESEGEEIEISDLQMWEIDLHGRALLPPEYSRSGWRLVQVELLPLAALRSPPPASRSRCSEECQRDLNDGSILPNSISMKTQCYLRDDSILPQVWLNIVSQWWLNVTSRGGRRPLDPISRFPHQQQACKSFCEYCYIFEISRICQMLKTITSSRPANYLAILPWSHLRSVLTSI